MNDENANEKLYQQRFSERDLDAMQAVWSVLGRYWFQQWISPDAAVLDVGAGSGALLNSLRARMRAGLDVRSKPAELDPAIAWHTRDWRQWRSAGQSFDVVITSNYLEHLRDRDDLLMFAQWVSTMLTPTGTWIILGPNIRYAGPRYWDFVDHRIALTDKALEELLRLAGFSVECRIPRFLPFTSKSGLPRHPWLVRLYLAFPWVWRVFGAQCFLVGRKRGNNIP